MRLSERMNRVVRLAGTGDVVADIGCDHGYVSIYLVREGIFKKAIAMDVRSGPLSRATANIAEAGMADVIETRLSDGLDALKGGEAECAVIAGMGGNITKRIIENNLDKARNMRLVLQPQSEIASVRRFVREKGFIITAEDIVYEEGIYYQMFVAEVQGGNEDAMAAVNDIASETQTEADNNLYDTYGPILLRSRNPVLLDYLKWEEGVYRDILEKLAERGIRGTGCDEVNAKYQLNKIAQQFY